MEEIKCHQIAQIESAGFNEMTGRVYSPNGVAPSVRTFCGGGQEVKILEEPVCGASRDRNPENPSSRKKADNYKQRFEVNTNGTTNTLTSVQKDNLIIDPQEKTRGDKFSKPNMEEFMENVPKNCRVRKLTERECFRLQGVKDEDFERVRKNQSKSSCYHLAGDSITTTVLMALFGELLDIDWKTKVDNLCEELCNGI